jgi:hypothetical protein
VSHLNLGSFPPYTATSAVGLIYHGPLTTHLPLSPLKMVLLHHRPSSAHILSQSAHELLFLCRDWMFPSAPDSSPTTPSNSIHDVWLASRRFEHKGEIGHLAPGAHRPFNLPNAHLAYEILRVHTFELFRTIWVPRTSLVFLFNLCRGVFPAFRGYSQALIIDEVRLLFTRAPSTLALLIPLTHTRDPPQHSFTPSSPPTPSPGLASYACWPQNACACS